MSVGHAETAIARPARLRRPRTAVGGVGPLGLGVATLWLSLIVLLPLAAVAVTSLEGGLAAFWDAVTAPSALAALAFTTAASAVVALVNVVAGALIEIGRAHV